MPHRLIERHQWQPRPVVSALLFTGIVGGMGYIRLVLFPDRVVALTYGLPLLVCLWYPSRRLLWSLAVAFAIMATTKTLWLIPEPMPLGERLMQLATQLINLGLMAVIVHLALALFERLQAKNDQLQHINAELIERDEAISRRNEELQAQSEELTQQNEEIEQQSEELQHQADVLEAQSQKLTAANTLLAQRQAVLEGMVRALHAAHDENAPQLVCDAALQLFASSASAVALVMRDGDELMVQGGSGRIAPVQNRWKMSASLAAIAMARRSPAAISDLALRPDIVVPAAPSGAFRASLAAPLWIENEPVGALEFYADQPHEWTQDHFTIIDWAAAQCSQILEARRLRQDLRTANAVLETQVRERTHELQDLVNELEHFSYTITHDLRAPLRAIQGYAGILDTDYVQTLDETGRGYLRRIIIASARMDQLITDALSYSRAVRQELEMVPVDAARLIRNILDSYPMLQPPKAVVEVSGPIPRVLANEAGLTQCLSNLLDNAVKFVARDTQPHVWIRAENRGEMVRIWIEDNGIGIAPQWHPKLFNMFQRLSKDYEGTGIGLALVRKVAERMGGRVGLESKLGEGSRFWLELRSADLGNS